MSRTAKLACDREAIGRAIQALNLPAPATCMGQYMVNKLGYDNSIMIWQLKQGLGMDESMIEECLNTLIMSDVVRQQPMESSEFSYVIDAAFGHAEVNADDMNSESVQECDEDAVGSAIRNLGLSEPATVIGEYMVKHLGYRYAVLAGQLKKRLATDESLIVACLEELVAHGVVRKQPSVVRGRTYVINPAFGEINRGHGT